MKKVKIGDLKQDVSISSYSEPGQAKCSPHQDANLLGRFFERCHLVLISGSVDEPLFVELIGRHAAWWDRALLEEDRNTRQALAKLAAWANEFANKNTKKYQYLSDWNTSLARDFPNKDSEHIIQEQ